MAVASGQQGATCLTTWSQFVAAFSGHFQITSAQEDAQFKLIDCKQGTGTAADYVTRFTALAVQTGFNDAALAMWFRQGH